VTTASSEHFAAGDGKASAGDAGRTQAVPLARGSDVPLARRHDALLFDLDGVLYVGPAAVPGASAAVAAARDAGCAVAFVTNNASRTPQTVAAHLRDLGIPAGPADIVTSAQAVAGLVAADVPAGAAVLVVGGEGLAAALRERGLRPVDSAAAPPAAVVQGFAPEVGWQQLAEGTYAVRAGVPWYASNLDATIPTARGIAPGNGALVDVVATATGRRPVVAGKPETPLHTEAVRRTGARNPLVVGDRLDTDIEGAVRAGAPSLLVLTGVTSPLELVQAPPSRRPTYVAAELGSGLHEPHPPVAVDGGSHRCGGWTVTAGAGGLELHGAGDRVDALRALCVAVWSAHGEPSSPARLPGGVAEALSAVGW